VRVIKKGSRGEVAYKLARGVLALALAFSTTGALTLATSTVTAIKAYADEATAQKIEITNLTGKTLAQATTTLDSLSTYGVTWEFAADNPQYSTATIDYITYKSRTDKLVINSIDTSIDTALIVHTKEAEQPTISDMQLGYYTGTYATNADGTQGAEVIRWKDVNAQDLTGEIITRGGSLRLALRVKWTGGSYEGSWVNWTSTEAGLSTSDIRWAVDEANQNNAKIDENGKVTATGLDDATITVTATLVNKTYNATTQNLSTSINIKLIGQQGDYPQSVAIVDEYGKVLGEGGVVIDGTDATADYQPYARVRYTDGAGNYTYKVTSPYCGDGCLSVVHQHVASIDNLEWSVGESSSEQTIINVNKTTGYITPSKDVAGTIKLWATVQGGRDGEVKNYTNIIVKGDTSAKPATELAVHVVYNRDRSTIVTEQTFDLNTLASVSSTGGYTHALYTQRKDSNGGTDYRTVYGEGVTVRDLLAALGVVDTSQVYTLIFKCTDGVVNGQVGASRLFSTNYFYPNYKQTNSNGVHNTSQAQAVEPMIAIKSSWLENDVNTDTSSYTLNGDNSFELLLGNRTESDNSASLCFYKIYDITVVLNGGPSVDFGNGGDGTGNGSGGGSGVGTTGSGESGEGDATDIGAGGDEGLGDDTGINIAMGIGGSPTNAAVNSAKQDNGSQAASQTADSELAADTGEQEKEKSSRWQVFEVMSNSDNALQLDYSNPYEKYIYACMIAAVFLGLFGSIFNMKKQLPKKNKSPIASSNQVAV
jgi:hypothetical protein